MVKLTRFITVLVACSLIGLAGCSGKDKDVKASKQHQKLEKEIKQVTLKPVEQPVLVNIIDPNSKKIVKSFIPKEHGFGTDYENYKRELKKWIRELARGTKDTPGYDKRMVLDKLDENGQIIKGTPQVILDETELLEKLTLASLKGGDIKLPIYVNASGYNSKDAARLGEAVIATYTTHFNSNAEGRSTNIALSAEAINNIIVGAGDSFSFNTTVGPSDAAHGYQQAPEIVNGKLVDGIGGGICQTSSTLFNAIDQLGVKYIEKHNHSLSVGYVPKGRDATVSYGGLDFRFINTIGVPVLIKSHIENGKLTIEIRTSNSSKSQMKQPT